MAILDADHFGMTANMNVDMQVCIRRKWDVCLQILEIEVLECCWYCGSCDYIDGDGKLERSLGVCSEWYRGVCVQKG